MTLKYLNLVGINTNRLPSPTVAAAHVTFSHVDISNNHTSICLNVVDNSPPYGIGLYTTIEYSKIHNCGRIPSSNQDHGLYISGNFTTIKHNYIYNNTDRGVQLRGSRGGVIMYNVIDRNGEGVLYGDITAATSAVDNLVAYNIVSRSQIRANVESYFSESEGVNNVFRDNCVWSTLNDGYYGRNGGIFTESGGFTAVNNTVVNSIMYRDANNGDYVLQPGSLCAGSRWRLFS